MENAQQLREAAFKSMHRKKKKAVEKEEGELSSEEDIEINKGTRMHMNFHHMF